MKNDRKRLMPEVLPQPSPAVPSASARQRVLKHMKLLIATGAATTTLAACPYGVVDPLPPPARCRTTGSVLDALQVSVEPDVSGGVVVQIVIDDDSSGNVRLMRVLELTGATERRVVLDGYPAEIYLTPDSPDATIGFTLATQCASAPANKVRIVLRPASPNAGTDAGSAPYTVTVSEVGADAGP